MNTANPATEEVFHRLACCSDNPPLSVGRGRSPKVFYFNNPFTSWFDHWLHSLFPPLSCITTCSSFVLLEKNSHKFTPHETSSILPSYSSFHCLSLNFFFSFLLLFSICSSCYCISVSYWCSTSFALSFHESIFHFHFRHHKSRNWSSSCSSSSNILTI